jgi:hypothetical protein
MNTNFTLLLFLFSLISAAGQGTFHNLGFDDGNLPPHEEQQTYWFPVTDALPGWTVMYGTQVQTSLSYNETAAGGRSRISIWENDVLQPFQRLSGRFALFFTRDFRDPVSLSLSQTGTVPSDAVWLLFEQRPYWIPGEMQVQLNGTSLSLQVMSNSAGWTLIGADVSFFAGQEVDLRVSTQYRDGLSPTMYFDNIQFSSVPEPGGLILLVAGGLGLLLWRRAAEKRSRRSSQQARAGPSPDG